MRRERPIKPRIRTSRTSEGLRVKPRVEVQPTAMCDMEKVVGEYARWFVRYRKDGREMFDAFWIGTTVDEARDGFLAVAREVGWNVEDVRVEAREVPS